MVQVPPVTNVTVPVDTAHTGKVVDVKTTARPEDAVALTANAVPNTPFARAPKVIGLACGRHREALGHGGGRTVVGIARLTCLNGTGAADRQGNDYAGDCADARVRGEGDGQA